jgi:hypothetical protein
MTWMRPCAANEESRESRERAPGRTRLPTWFLMASDVLCGSATEPEFADSRIF